MRKNKRLHLKDGEGFVLCWDKPLSMRKVKPIKIFSLFEVDNWSTTSSRIFLGNFSSRERALDAFKKNSHKKANLLIIETELNKFEEL